ncbi:MAG: elongation factor G [Candidatus Omnitrophota bacterium]
MANLDPKYIRNILLAGHSRCGKTSIIEALLYSSKTIPKMGSVDSGSAISDYNDDEKERKSSISSSLISFESNGKKVNIIDTPGYADFVGEIIGGLRGVEASIIVVNASGGVEIGTERSWKLSRESNKTTALFVNKLDKENTDFERTVEAVQKKFGKLCVAVTYPIGKGESISGVANLLTGEGIDKLSEDDKIMVQTMSEALTEAIAESDDALLEKFLESGELSPDEKKKAFTEGLITGKIVPIFSGVATKNVGVKELLDAITEEFPSPADAQDEKGVSANTNEEVPLELKADASLSALIVKTLSDPYLGQISIFKIFQGSIKTNSSVYNISKRTREKFGQLFSLLGKAQTAVESISAGDIGCVAKLKETRTGDSVGDEKNPIKLPEIVFPVPAISFSIKPKTRADEDKIANALHKLTAEDPTFKVGRDDQTNELIASGMGDMHVGLMINRMRQRYAVEVELGTPKVAYLETITGKSEAQHRHKKQSGGAGQFGEVWLRIEPMPHGGGFEFVDEVVGGSIPAQFVVSCEKGVRSALKSGALAGNPIVDVKVIVYDGKTHPVDSKDIAFQIAAREAFKEAFIKAKPVLLEPIMNVDVIVPDEFMGDITGSLNSRRGRIMGMEPGESRQVIKAQVPLEEMYKYVNELKSITGGRGAYSMTFSHYETVPAILMQQIVAKAQQAKQEKAE